VGAKDIVCKGCGLIYKQGELKNSLQIILSNPSLITEMSENICKSNFKYSLNNHVTEIINIYENIIDEAKK